MNRPRSKTGKDATVPFYTCPPKRHIERSENIETGDSKGWLVGVVTVCWKIGHLLIHGGCIESFTHRTRIFDPFDEFSRPGDPELIPETTEKPLNAKVSPAMYILYYQMTDSVTDRKDDGILDPVGYGQVTKSTTHDDEPIFENGV